jgi:aldehyde dehydrogenase (NAD+)
MPVSPWASRHLRGLATDDLSLDSGMGRGDARTMTTSTSSVLASHWIGGQAATDDSAATLDVVNPATGAVIGAVTAGTPADVDAAVAAAAKALPGWAATTPAERAEVLLRLSAGLASRREEIAQLVTAETGSPITLSRGMQVDFPVGHAAAVAGLAAEFPWTERVANSTVVREPIGVVGAITPWNFPLLQMMGKVAPALMAGNAIVLKPSELTPLTARILAEEAARAGVPDGVLNIVHGTGPVVGEAIAAHPGIGMVSFTGSTRAGRRVAEVASATLKRVCLELGGKSANVILPDADVEQAVAAGLANAWTNGGQVCAAWTRMLVPADRQDEIVTRLVKLAAEYTVGDPTAETTRLGPVVSETQRQRVDGYIQRGIADGATVAFGGAGRPDGFESGAYVRPTIFANVDPGSAIAQEEIFGPVLAVIPYRDEEDAVAIANNSNYGLAGAVFGEQEHALAVAARMQTGTVDVNAPAFNFNAPVGGYKQSGNGARELGTFGIDEYLQIKSIQL